MCLFYDRIGTENFRKENAGKTITVWKTVKKCDNNYKSIYMEEIIPVVGIYKSNRHYIKLTTVEKDCGEIDYGIHTYGTRKYARRYATIDKNRKVIKCEAKMEDFVGVNYGQSELVFTKVKILSQRKKGH